MNTAIVAEPAVQKETRDLFSERVKAAKDRAALEGLEWQITRHYDAGTISAFHLGELDKMIMHRLVRL